jgi:hypothetical protein
LKRPQRWQFLIPIFLSILSYICTIADRCHSKDATDHREDANYDHDFLRRTQTNRIGHLTQSK